MRRVLARFLPAVVVVLLLALATSHLRAMGSWPPPPPACDYVVDSQTSGTTSTALAPGVGVIQPLGLITNLSQVRLDVLTGGYAYAFTRVSVLSWDPQALAPDASTIALRSAELIVSSYVNVTLGPTLVPPVVLRSLSNVAEPMRSTSAI